MRGARAENTRARRRVLVAFAAFGGWWGGWGASLPAVERSAHVDHGDLGVALLFVGIGALASMRLTGALIDRFGHTVLPVAMVVFALAGVGPGFAHGAVQLAGALLMVGLASGAVDVAINAASSRYEAVVHRPVMNLAHASFSVGVIFASAVVGVMRATHLHPGAILGFLGIVLVLAATWIHLEAYPGVRINPAMAAAQPAAWRWFAPPRRLLVLGLFAALAYMVENAWQSWSALHLERTMSAAPMTGALGPAVFGAAAAAGRFVGHRVSPTFTQQNLVRIGAAIAAVGTLVAAGAPVLPVAFAGIAAAGLGTAVCAPALFSLAGSGVPEHRRGATIATVTTLAYLGFVLAPALVGLTARLTSLPTALATVSAAALVLALFAGRAHSAGTDERVQEHLSD